MGGRTEVEPENISTVFVPRCPSRRSERWKTPNLRNSNLICTPRHTKQQICRFILFISFSLYTQPKEKNRKALRTRPAC